MALDGISDLICGKLDYLIAFWCLLSQCDLWYYKSLLINSWYKTWINSKYVLILSFVVLSILVGCNVTWFVWSGAHKMQSCRRPNDYEEGQYGRFTYRRPILSAECWHILKVIFLDSSFLRLSSTQQGSAWYPLTTSCHQAIILTVRWFNLIRTRQYIDGLWIT